jgi:serine/threonine-protein kinase
VGAAHAKGIVHRDLKPDNIFLVDHDDQQDFVKLLDFGISKMIDPDLQVAATKLTTTGVVMGTPLYMAPEQAMGAEIDHLADVYACGVMLYEMLAGKPPFDGATYAVLVAKLLTSEPPLLADIRPGLSPKLVAAVHRALEKDPAARFQSADAFSAALPQLTSASAMELATTQASGKRAAVRPPGGKPRRWPMLAATLAMLAGVGTMSAIILASNKSGSSTTEPVAAPPAKAEPAKPESHSGLISVHSIPAGATITVDGQPLADGAMLAVELGKHKIHAELIGYTPVDIEEEVVEGVKSSVPLRLQPMTMTPPSKTPGKTGAVSSKAGPKGGTKTHALTPAELDALQKAALPDDNPPPAKVPPPPPPIKKVEPPPTKTPPTGPDTKPNPY